MHDSTRPVRDSTGQGLEDAIAALEASFTTLPFDEKAFTTASTRVAAFQREHVPVYRRYWDAIRSPTVPYLPIRAFKDVDIMVGGTSQAEAVFISSGTGGKERSRHFVKKTSVYDRSLATNFERRFGHGPFTLVAHLPVYHELGAASSLVYMAHRLIDRFGDDRSGFSLRDTTLLTDAIQHSRTDGTTLILFGAAFGLLDLAETRNWQLPSGAIVIETGGMKTRRREVTRDALHSKLSRGFGVPAEAIHSEYGMCELLSQFYTCDGDLFFPPAWARFTIRSVDNPLADTPDGHAGVLAVTDLANMYSVSAILTEDLAEREGDGFRLLGRLRGSDLRGCNQLIEAFS